MTEPSSRTRFFERFLTFVDAIVAIAITLLILPLVDLVSENHGTTTDLLREHQSNFYAFALSFLVIYRLWWSQHRMLEHVSEDKPAIVRVLMLWVFTVVFLPFPTALVAAGHDEIDTRALYIGTMTVSAAALALLALVTADAVPADRKSERPDLAVAVFTAVYMLAALVISVAIPATSYYPLLLLVLPKQSARWWHRQTSRR